MYILPYLGRWGILIEGAVCEMAQSRSRRWDIPLLVCAWNGVHLGDGEG